MLLVASGEGSGRLLACVRFVPPLLLGECQSCNRDRSDAENQVEDIGVLDVKHAAPYSMNSSGLFLLQSICSLRKSLRDKFH